MCSGIYISLEHLFFQVSLCKIYMVNCGCRKVMETQFSLSIYFTTCISLLLKHFYHEYNKILQTLLKTFCLFDSLF